LEHHFDTVVWSFPNWSASQRFVLWASANAPFILFIVSIGDILGFDCKFSLLSSKVWQNLPIIFKNKAKY